MLTLKLRSLFIHLHNPIFNKKLKSLVDKNILVQIENIAGRNIAYKINHN